MARRTVFGDGIGRRDWLRFATAAVLGLLAAIFAGIGGPTRADDRKDPKKDDTLSDKGFVSIFDGKTLTGWHVSAETGHSAASKNKSGGRWVAEDGAIVGSQDIPGNGGIVITDAEFGDIEVALEMKSDFGPDSGLFLRSTEEGKCYQAMIDYHKDGNLMGIYGEGLSGGIVVRNFTFKDKVTDIKEDNCIFPLPVSPDKWSGFWKHGEWNELRARIEGNPPKVTTWIKGVKFLSGPTRRSGTTPTKAASPCRSTAAAISPSSSCATATSGSRCSTGGDARRSAQPSGSKLSEEPLGLQPRTSLAGRVFCASGTCLLGDSVEQAVLSVSGAPPSICR